MSRITEAFSSAPNGKAFIPFITAGDPSLEVTEQLVYALEEAGADIIELGIPFSDPTAEGPVIQEANLRALTAGTTPAAVMEMVKRIRTRSQVPLVFMTYANVVYSRGTREFINAAAEAGIDGLILADVPFEEKEEFDGPCKQAGIDFISMIAPTSDARIAEIAGQAQGFVYCVSSLGVTGVRSEITTDIGAMVQQVRAATSVPAAIGFGISTPAQAGEMAAKADGAIVGSALVKMVGEYGVNAVEPISAFARELAAAVHSA